MFETAGLAQSNCVSETDSMAAAAMCLGVLPAPLHTRCPETAFGSATVIHNTIPNPRDMFIPQSCRLKL